MLNHLSRFWAETAQHREDSDAAPRGLYVSHGRFLNGLNTLKHLSQNGHSIVKSFKYSTITVEGPYALEAAAEMLCSWCAEKGRLQEETDASQTQIVSRKLSARTATARKRR